MKTARATAQTTPKAATSVTWPLFHNLDKVTDRRDARRKRISRHPLVELTLRRPHWRLASGGEVADRLVRHGVRGWRVGARAHASQC